MDRVKLSELHFSTRKEAIGFLKRLWDEVPTPCPFCGQLLEPLHKKAKKDDSDWQCRACDKAIKAMYLLEEINDALPQ